MADADAENALRRWWQHDRPAIDAELRKEFVVGNLDERTTRLLYRSIRVAFLEGWKARGRHTESQGDLFGGGNPP